MAKPPPTFYTGYTNLDHRAVNCITIKELNCALALFLSKDGWEQPCGRRGRYAVARLIERHGCDIRMPDLPAVLADCPKARSASVYDRCKAVYEKPGG
jgi:hypothetical protein